MQVRVLPGPPSEGLDSRSTSIGHRDDLCRFASSASNSAAILTNKVSLLEFIAYGPFRLEACQDAEIPRHDGLP